jgi:hypothetical protein
MPSRNTKLLPSKALGSPKNGSARALGVHARLVAKTLGLTRDQARVLCNEIRNAVCPLALSIDDITPGVARSDARTTLELLLAMVEAIELPYFGPPPPGSLRPSDLRRPTRAR